MQQYSEQEAIKYLESIGIDHSKYYKQEPKKEDTNEEPYWKYIQGYYNPYGKELYDYVAAHKNIKLSKNEKIATRELKELNYKIHTCPDELDKPTLLCEKSIPRLLIEFLLDIPDLI